jgi:hypothetical protein
MDRKTAQLVQSNLVLCAGIAIGIGSAVNKQIDPNKSYFQNAFEILADSSDELIKSIVRELQEAVNEAQERRSLEKAEKGGRLGSGI